MKENKHLIGTIGKGTLVLFSTNIVLKGIMLATVFLILNRLSAYDYGVFELASSAVALFSIFLLPGITNTLVADLNLERSRKDLPKVKGLLVSFFKTQMFLCLIAWILIFFGADIISKFYEHQITSLIQILSFSYLVAPFRNMLAIVFRAYLSFRLQALHSVTEAVVRLAVLSIGFFVFGIGFFAVALAGVVSEFVAFILFAYSGFVVSKELRNITAAPIPVFSPLYFHGKWSVFSSYFNTIGQNIRLWTIQFFLGAEAVGYFSVAYGILQHTMDFVPFGSVMTPIIPTYINDRARIVPILHKAIKYQLIAYTLLALVALIVFTPILAFLFPRYSVSLPIFNFMLLALLPMSFAAIFTPTFFALRAQKSLFWSIGIKNLAIVILAPLCLVTFGLMGVAVEFVLTNAVFALERYRLLRTKLPGFAFTSETFFVFDEYDKMVVEGIRSKIFPTR